MFKKLVLPSLAVLLYVGSAYSADNADSVKTTDPVSTEVLQPITPQDAATNPKIDPPADLLNLPPTGEISDNGLNKAGIYPMGGKMLIDRSLQISGAVTVSSVSVTTVTFTDGTTLTTAPSAAVVFQVSSGTTVSQTATTSSSFQQTNLKASITPKAASHRILIIVSGGLQIGANGVFAVATIERGTTDLSTGTGFVSVRQSIAAGIVSSNGSMVTVDSPATTSATTYTVYVKNTDGATTAAWVNGNGESSSIVLMEIL